MTYECGRCGRRLKPNMWVYSTWTGNRYCWPGEGCMKKNARRTKRVKVGA